MKQTGGTGYDYGELIKVGVSGNIYSIAGFQNTVDFDFGIGTYNLTSTATSKDAVIWKNDANGNFIWAKPLLGTYSISVESMTLDAQENIYITGCFVGTVDFDPGPANFDLTNAGGDDIFIAKYDSNGNLIWAKRIGNSSSNISNAIVLDNSSSVYIAGYSIGDCDFDPGPGTYIIPSLGFQYIFVCKLDDLGDFVWAKQIGGSNYNEANSMVMDANENLILTGYFQNVVDFEPNAGIYNLVSAGYYDIFVCKLDTTGQLIWAKQMGGIDEDRGINIITDAGNNIYITGVFEDTVDFDPSVGTYNLVSVGSQDAFISKLDPDGNFLYAKQIGSTDYDNGWMMAIDIINSLYITGVFYNTVDLDPGPGVSMHTPLGDKDNYFLKLDSLGDYIWGGQIGGYGGEYLWGMDIDSSGNIYTSGYVIDTADIHPTDSINYYIIENGGGSDIFIAKFSQLPSISDQITDTLVCSGSSLDFYTSAIGIPPFTYQWQKNSIDIIGADSSIFHIQSVSISDEGIYTCLVSNQYGTVTSDDIELRVITISPDAGNDTIICQGESAQLFATASSNYAAESGSFTYLWSPASDLTSDDIPNPVADPLITTDFIIYITDQLGCSSSDTMRVYLQNPYYDQQLCIVSVDPTVGKNKIMWEKVPDVGTQSYIIYKEISTNFYGAIGLVPAADTSYFIDYASNPESHGDKYKIAVLDTCQNESELDSCAYHKTINLVIAAFGSTMGLSWDYYEVEDGSFVPDKYYIYRGTTPSNLQLLDSISGSFNTYNDVNVFNDIS
ncbi:MAG: immunoglobulin domain-containing protein [Bacteroidota bacterium]